MPCPDSRKRVLEGVLDNLDDLPSAYELASTLREHLEEEQKDIIMDYLAGHRLEPTSRLCSAKRTSSRR